MSYPKVGEIYHFNNNLYLIVEIKNTQPMYGIKWLTILGVHNTKYYFQIDEFITDIYVGEI